jgi:hypothetical protein
MPKTIKEIGEWASLLIKAKTINYLKLGLMAGPQNTIKYIYSLLKFYKFGNPKLA